MPNTASARLKLQKWKLDSILQNYQNCKKDHFLKKMQWTIML